MSKMDLEYLKYKIRIQKMNNCQFAKKIGLSRAGFYKKMRGDTEWTCEEMKRIKKTLGLSLEEFNKIFGF